LNDWNTMPTSERSFLRSVLGSRTDMPSTTMSPAWMRSSPLMQRSSVLLPEPLGPQTTTTSPSWTSSDTPRSAWKSP